MMNRAYSYIGFSQPRHIRPEVLAERSKLAHHYAAAKGLVLDQVLSFQDVQFIAKPDGPDGLGGLGDFLLAVRHRLAPRSGTFIVERLDQTSLDCPRTTLRILEALCDEGISVATLIDRKEYTSEILDKEPEALPLTLMLFNSSDKTGASKSAGRKQYWKAALVDARKRRKNPRILNCLPGWLRRDPVEGYMVIPERADTVRRAFRLAESGIGAGAIATMLNKDGIPTFGSGSKWHHRTVSNLLNSRAVIGQLVPAQDCKEWWAGDHLPGVPIEDFYPAIISRRSWHRVQHHLYLRHQQWKAQGVQVTWEVQNLFAGLATCPLCGSPMKRKNFGISIEGSQQEPSVWLVCISALNKRGCKYLPVSYQAVESAFLARAPDLLTTAAERIGKHLHAGPSISPHDDLVYQARRQELAQLLARDNLDRANINLLLRSLFKGGTVELERKVLTLTWRSGETASISFSPSGLDGHRQ